MTTSDKLSSRKQPEAFPASPPIGAIMADRLRTALGAIDSAFLYRNEALDALAFTLTGLPSGPHRDAAFEKVLAALDDVARPGPDVAIAAMRGAA